VISTPPIIHPKPENRARHTADWRGRIRTTPIENSHQFYQYFQTVSLTFSSIYAIIPK
jgi:hypothetical protein